jgi:hypothetical protein
VSFEPLRITAGNKAASLFAGFTQLIGTFWAAVIVVPAGIGLLDPLEQKAPLTMLLLIALGVVLASVAAGLCLIRLALGRSRTRGSVARYTCVQLSAFGVGLAVGIGAAPFMHEMGPVARTVGIVLAVLTIAASLSPHLLSRREVYAAPPYPGIALVPGTVVDRWRAVHAGRTGAFELTVLAYPDQWGRTRYVRHLPQQPLTVLGAVGQMQIDTTRPHARPRFVLPRRHRAVQT